MNIHLSFTSQQMDYVANVLAQRPYGEVAQLIQEIQRQIAEQQYPLVPPKANGHDTSVQEVS